MPMGLVLGKVDEKFTRQLYKASQARSSVQSQGSQTIGMKYLPWSEKTTLLLIDVTTRAFGEEGVRVGLWALFAGPISTSPLFAALLAGILLGLGHVIYGAPALPAKLLDNVVISLVMLYFGVVVAFLVHLGLNFYMLFDIQIVSD